MMETSGLYTCLVTGGDIPFKEDSATRNIKVAGTYKGPLQVLVSLIAKQTTGKILHYSLIF